MAEGIHMTAPALIPDMSIHQPTQDQNQHPILPIEMPPMLPDNQAVSDWSLPGFSPELPEWQFLSDFSTPSQSSQGYLQRQGSSPWMSVEPDSYPIAAQMTPNSTDSRTDGAVESHVPPIGNTANPDAKRKASPDTTKLVIVQYGDKEPEPKQRKIEFDLSSNRTISNIVRYDNKGQVQSIEHVYGTPNRKCDLHEKSPYEPCSACASTKRYKGISRFPCFLSRVSEAIFFRKGPSFQSPLYFERPSVYDLSDIAQETGVASQSSRELRTLELTQIAGARIEVRVTKFEQRPGDKVNRKVFNEDGDEYVLEMPHYCLTDLEKIQHNLKTYISNERGRYLDLLKEEGGITALTADTAIEYASKHPNSLTSMALDMWAYCRVIENPWSICGDDTLGLRTSPDPKSRWHRFIPITPMMDVQLDQIIIRNVLEPLRNKLLDLIDSTIQSLNPEKWFDCFISIYLLLNHIEWAVKHGNRFSKKYGLARRFSDMKLTESWFHTCKILLSRFHFINNGSAPFRLDWTKSSNVKFARLDELQVKFMQNIQHSINSSEPYFDTLRTRHQYEKDLYWTHQLFVNQWTPGLPHIVDELPG
ncbi:hypothetical protein F4820DRAFT_467432 [Hypoxylon rubiginosum]|uniref:Uncharacterized protein n=1 Tax=Hypoxylon rubiginosum TaxID=110542 RepID=A0ACB9YIL1_9PEZI|nr:hypothetical protein F4820DRAFT_467432 [Hypoxylon rubiginosum]